jgi:hypothetical protein
MANSNALWLLVQVHGLPQHDDSKEGGTEHAGVSGMVVAVPKLRAVHRDALGVRYIWPIVYLCIRSK